MNGDQGGNPPGEGLPGPPGGPRPGDYSAPGTGASIPGGVQPPTAGAQTPGAQPPPAGAQTPGAQPPPAGAQVPGVQPPPAGAPPLSQGGQGAGIPDGGPLPPLPRRSEKKVQKGGGGGRLVVTALIAGLVAALLVLLLMPWAFGVNPYDLVRGKLKKAVVLEEKAEPGRNVTVVSPTEGSMSVTSISKAVIPSIVNIDIRTAPQQTPLFTTQAQEGTGSGVIYTQDGYIITNNHVVEGAQQITVTLASGESVPGKVVGADAENDIAVVKIEKTGLPAMSFGNSDNLVVGQLAVAVGSPFGFEQTVTSGIISALHRSISTGSQTTGQASTLTDLIQTDASINPGNSGGALCDGNAKLVGINAVIASQSGGSEGIGFAIPANTAKLVADNIIGGKPISHPYIGILGQTVSQDIATQYNLPVNTGAYVTNVVPDGPAAKAGIKAGDIIVAIDGTPVKSMDDLVAQVRKSQVGSTVTITYYAGNDKKTTQVTLEEKPKNATQ